MVRIGSSVGCGPVPSAVVYIAVQTNVARNAFRDAPTIPLYMTALEPNLLWDSSFVREAWNRKTKKTAALTAPEHSISWVRILAQPSVH